MDSPLRLLPILLIVSCAWLTISCDLSDKRFDPPQHTIREAMAKAEAGNAMAQYVVGSSYYYGDSLPQNTTEAAHWLRLAADQGQTDAAYLLSCMYFDGEGVTQNNDSAAHYCHIAAQSGEHYKATYTLGCCYMYGVGVAQDTAEALRWFRRPELQEHQPSHRRIEEILSGQELTPTNNLHP